MKHLKEAVVAVCMDRRKLLGRFGAVLGTASLGGCLSRYDEIAGGTDGTTTGTTATTVAEETGPETTATTTTQPVTLGDTSFEITDTGCGQPTSEAGVSFDEENAITITGTISGSNACYTATLADVSYDPETGALEVTVSSMQKQGAEACAQCIVEIDYEATVSFEGGLPATVRVVHQTTGGTETVTTAGSA